MEAVHDTSPRRISEKDFARLCKRRRLVRRDGVKQNSLLTEHTRTKHEKKPCSKGPATMEMKASDQQACIFQDVKVRSEVWSGQRHCWHGFGRVPENLSRQGPMGIATFLNRNANTATSNLEARA